MYTVLILSNLALVKQKVENAVGRGTRLLSAENEEDALYKLAENGGADFAVLDDEMPGDIGEKTLLRIRERGFQMPVVMLGDKADGEKVLRGFALGADDYVEYNISAELLRAKIHVIMRRASK